MQRRTLMSAIGAVALSSAAYFPMSLRAATLQGDSGNPIRIVVPYPPGGPLDVSARLIADALVPTLGTVVVENRPGAGGNVGMSYVKRQKGDGHTLVMGALATLAVNPHLFKALPYDAKKDFKAVTLVAKTPNVLVITPEFSRRTGVKTVADLAAYAKAHPGELNYASGGNGSGGHICGELFKARTGADAMHIPFAGASPAVLSLLGGQTDFLFDNLASCSANLKAGKLIALAVTTAQRSAQLPDTPTMEEAGVPDFDIYTWYGLMVPGTTDDATVATLAKPCRDYLSAPETKKRFLSFGAEVAPDTPQAFDKLIADEYAKYAELVKLAHAAVD